MVEYSTIDYKGNRCILHASAVSLAGRGRGRRGLDGRGRGETDEGHGDNAGHGAAWGTQPPSFNYFVTEGPSRNAGVGRNAPTNFFNARYLVLSISEYVC
jgi:hypothetical protein